MIDQFRQAFREEASELLEELDGCLLALRRTPEDPELVARLFRAMHTLKGSSGMFDFIEIHELAHEVETVLERVRGKILPVTPALIDAIFEARDCIGGLLHCSGDPDESLGARAAAVTAALGSLSGCAGDEASGVFLFMGPEEEPIGEEMQRQAGPTEEQPGSGWGTEAAIDSVRVPSSRLDDLVDLVGEMVTVQARISRAAADRNTGDFAALAEELERLTAGLRDRTLSLRMLPVAATFRRFHRLVHDLSAALGKEIVLELEGGETELDKTVIEKIADPLVHLIRNCADHGIESPEARSAAGKNPRGVIRLSALHAGDSVLITVEDDGKGIDPAAVRARAVEKGLIPTGADLSRREVLDLIFVPGFSTRMDVTSVSGRGVGMDAVKRAVENLRGTVSVESSSGAGTRFSLRIPLTLAIIESLLVRVGEEHFAFPLSQVEECIEIGRDERERRQGRNLTSLRGGIIPYIPLREHFGIPGERPEHEQVVIASVGERRVGFAVDRVIGGHQAVVKSLGRLFRAVEGVSGATILGDGRVGLVLDLMQLVEKEEAQELLQPVTR